MKRVSILSICLSAILLTACNKEEVIETNTPRFEVTAKILSTGQTRTPQLDTNGAGHFSQGDNIALFFHTPDRKDLPQFAYTIGNRYYWCDLQLPNDATTLTLSGSYPPIVSQTPETVEWNVKDHAEEADILLAVPTQVTRNQTQIVLPFRHVLHKLAVTLVPDGETVTADMLQHATITCYHALPTAKLNLLEGKAISAMGEPATFMAVGKDASFLIPAQPTAGMSVTIQIGNNKATYHLDTDIKVNGQTVDQLPSGHSLSLKIKVRKGSFSIIGQQISGWESQGEFEDTIII